MTAIERQFDTEINVYRLESGTGNKRVYSSIAVLTLYGAKMPAQAEDLALLDGAFSEASKLFTPRADIRKSDKLIITGQEYFVAGKEDFDRGTNQHLELIIYKPN